MIHQTYARGLPPGVWLWSGSISRTGAWSSGMKASLKDGGIVAVGEETEAIQKKLGEANSCLSDLGYHVSVGVYQKNVPAEMDRLIKQAESNKYEEKEI